jgi:hypothetical protein
MVSPEAENLKQRFAEFSARALGRPVAEMRALFPTFADVTGKPAGVTWTEVDAGGRQGTGISPAISPGRSVVECCPWTTDWLPSTPTQHR